MPDGSVIPWGAGKTDIDLGTVGGKPHLLYACKTHSPSVERCSLSTGVPEPYGEPAMLFCHGRACAFAMSFSPPDIEKVERSVTQKFGKPISKNKSAIQNRMGAAFDQIEVTWKVRDVFARATMRAASTDIGMLFVACMPILERAQGDDARDVPKLPF